jgi:hypothetical protein
MYLFSAVIGPGAAERSETRRTVAWLGGYVIYELPLELSLSHVADRLNLLTDRPLAFSRSFLSTVLSHAQCLTSHKQSTEPFPSTVPPYFQFPESPPCYSNTQITYHVNITAFFHEVQLYSQLNGHPLSCPSSHPIRRDFQNQHPSFGCHWIADESLGSLLVGVKYSSKTPARGLSPPTVPLIPIPSRPNVRH